jgi:AcrR family transcriptional regulator
MVAAACEHGIQTVTVAHVVAQAGVSRKTFYEFFDGYSDCLLDSLERVIALIAQRTLVAYQTERTWLDRTRAALQIILQFFDEDPALARLCIIESAVGGPAVLARRRELLDLLTQFVDEGRNVTRRKPPPLAGEGAVGGTFEVIHARLLESDHRPLVELLGQLMSFIVLPYLGIAAAQRELHRPLVTATSGAGRPDGVQDRVESLPMRLTYRTVAVLAVIAGQPGLSNVQISKHADVTDQGQISKLLGRLARLQLIENLGAGRSGSPNAWRLTRRGEAVERSIRHGRLTLDRPELSSAL